MFKNFSSQPANYLGYRMGPVGSNGISMTADDLRGQVKKGGDFFDFSNFVECGDCQKNEISDFTDRNSKLNADGAYGGYSKPKFDWASLGKDVLTGGIKYYTSQQQAEATREAQALQYQQNQGRALDLQKEKEQTSQIKAYVLPIAIAGGVIIAGIAAYFIFKKKAKV